MIPLTHGLILSVIIFILGLTSLIVRRNLFFIMIGIDIMLNATSLAFITASSYWNQLDGQVMYIFTTSLAAAKTSIMLALLLKFARLHKTLNVDSLNKLHG